MRMTLTTLVLAGVLPVLWTAPLRAEITVTRAEYAAGVLVVAGETSRRNQKVTLDRRYTTRTDRNNRFRFRIRYLPRDCTATLRAGRQVRPAVISNCNATTVPGVGPPRRQTAPGPVR